MVDPRAPEPLSASAHHRHDPPGILFQFIALLVLDKLLDTPLSANTIRAVALAVILVRHLDF
jgi:hypothetical protein